MPLLPRSSRSPWHNNVIATGADRCLATGNLPAFPLAQLRELTASHIAKRKLTPQSSACDQHLSSLLSEHVLREGGSLDIAVVACLPFFSKPVGLSSLIQLRGDGQDHPPYTKYLCCLLLARQAAPYYVSDPELEIVEALLRIRNGHKNPGLYFRYIITDLGSMPESYLLSLGYINRLLDFCRFRRSFEHHLDWLRTQRRFMSLYNDVSWIKSIPTLRFSGKAMHVLAAQVPSWRLWISWNPSCPRLQKWESRKFTKTQVIQLARLFDLEGPDVTHSGRATLKDVPGAARNIVPDGSDPTFLQRLLNTLDLAGEVGSAATDLFIYLCIKNPSTDTSLALVSRLLEPRDEICCKTAQSIIHASAPNTGFNDRLVALTDGLPFLQIYPSLRELCSETIVEDITDTMRTAQREYCSQLQDGIAENLAIKIHAFGRAILDAAWPRAVLPAPFLQMLQNFPAPDMLRDILDKLQQASRSTKSLKEYLAASLGGRGGDLAPHLALIQMEQKFWGRPDDAERSSVVYAIRDLPCVQDANFIMACQDQVLAEDKVLLRDLLPIISGKKSMSCIDFARVLGRRRELQCAVHKVWPTLLLAMMEERASSMLQWACESLTFPDWFRWLADLEVIFTGEEQAVLQLKLGLTTELQDWWSQLASRYLGAVQVIDGLQGGNGSLRWLYFREVSHIEALLDAIQAGESRPHYFTWALSYFKSDVTTIARLCSCIMDLGQTSESGKQAIASILARQALPAGQWPGTATNALSLGWIRSLDSAERDRAAIRSLCELTGLRLEAGLDGFNAAQGVFMKDFEVVITRAMELETIRVSLRLHDAARTSQLLERLGVEDLRGMLDAAVPDELIDVVECIGDQEYEICFPLASVRKTTRIIQGMGKSSRLLLVRVSYGLCPGFSVHVHSGEHEQLPRRERTVTRQMTARMACSTASNPLTYVLGQALHRQFSKANPSLISIHEQVSTVVQSPASACMVCSSPLGSRVWRPTICSSQSCGRELSQAPLEVRLYQFIDDLPVLDFLLCCLYAAAQDTGNLDLTPGCPFDKPGLSAVINSFPALTGSVGTVRDLLNQIGDDQDAMSQKRKQLLGWICTAFRGCLLSAPQGHRIPLLPGVTQFLLFNSTPEREQAFTASSGGATTAAAAATPGGGVVFHGTPSARLWKVLTEGLRNMTNSPFMVHGAVNGPGVYLADEPSTSMTYGGSMSNTWLNSQFSNRKILLGCELQGHSARSTHTIADDSRVLVRYVFLCPPDFSPPQARLIENAMRMTYTALAAGPG